MSAALCFLFPPVILMYIRDKILGDRIKCNFHGSAMDFLREYLLSACFLNFTVLAVNYLLLHHNDSVEDAPTNLDSDYNDIWLIWEDELDENAIADIEGQHYTAEESYEGDFADGLYYYVYQLHRNQ